MKVLIIGGTGLISTSITRQLLAAGHAVTLYNRGRTTPRTPPGAVVVHGDRTDFPAFAQAMHALPDQDAVIDMVCFKPAEAASLAEAWRGRCGQVVFCSTVDVYSKPPGRFPVTEAESRQALSDYGQNKVRCEDLLRQAEAQGAFPLTILRPAHTYGEGGILIHTFGWDTRFLDRLARGKPVVLHGDGSALWVSCHIDDVAAAFVASLANSKALGRDYHLTGEEWLTWNRYYETVAEAVGGPPPRIVHMPTDFLMATVPDWSGVVHSNFQYTNIFDNTRARQDLGFRQTIPLLEGARRTAGWLLSHGGFEPWENDPLYDRLIEAWNRLTQTLAEEIRAFNRQGNR